MSTRQLYLTRNQAKRLMGGVKFSLVVGIFVFIFTGCGSNNIKKAQQLIDSKMFDQAITTLQEEIRRNPKNARAYFVLGNAYWCRGNHEDKKESIKAYENAIRIKPGYLSAKYNLGVILQFSELEQSINNLNKVLDISPNHIGALTYLGYIFDMNGEKYKAYTEIQKSLKIQPIEEKWLKLKTISKRDSLPYGTFIVKVDSTPVFSIKNDRKSGQLGKYSILTFNDSKNHKLFFTEVIYEKRKGWSLENPKYWSRVLSGFQYLPVVFRKLPPNTTDEENRVWNRYINWLKKFDYDLLDKEERRTATCTGLRKTTERHSYYEEWYQVAYKKKIYNERWINRESIFLGTGDEKLDKQRLNSLIKRKYWTEEQKKNILDGLITKGMTRYMVMAALGDVSFSFLYPREEYVNEIWTYGNMGIIFKDGRLYEWREMTTKD